MSETSVIQEIENELIQSGQFRYEPQYPSDLAAAIEEAELHRVNGAFRGHFNLDYPVDSFRIITEKPRKLSDETVRKDYGARHAWSLRFSPEFHGQLKVNPFEQEQSETQVVIQDGKAKAAIYNFGGELDEDAKETILGTYDWFNNFTHGQFAAVERMIVTDDLDLVKTKQEDALKLGTTIGLHYPFLPGTVLFDKIVFDKMVQIDSYRSMLAGGVSLADLVVTHEFAHALAANTKTEEAFAKVTDWQTHRYSLGKKRQALTWEITGQGDKMPALPPTSLGDFNAAEDLAETITTFRFKPEFLDDARYTFMAELSQSFVSDWFTDEQPTPTSMEQMSQPVYPYHRVPAKIGARVLTAAQLNRLEAYDRFADEVSGAFNMMGVMRRHFDALDRMDEVQR